MHIRTQRQPAFTLIELLVVISIIALLISLLVTALTRARDYAMQGKCGSNLKQIGTSIFAFAAEHNGELVNGPNMIHDYFNGFGIPINHAQAADSQIWEGNHSSGTQFHVGNGKLHEGYFDDDKALYCPGDNTTDPVTELAKIDTAEDAYSSYIYRNLDEINGSDKLDSLGSNSQGNNVVAIMFDRQVLVTQPASAFRTNHGNDTSGILFLDGHVTHYENAAEANLFTIRANDLNFLGRLDEILVNADHAGASGNVPYPFP